MVDDCVGYPHGHPYDHDHHHHDDDYDHDHDDDIVNNNDDDGPSDHHYRPCGDRSPQLGPRSGDDHRADNNNDNHRRCGAAVPGHGSGHHDHAGSPRSHDLDVDDHVDDVDHLGAGTGDDDIIDVDDDWRAGYHGHVNHVARGRCA